MNKVHVALEQRACPEIFGKTYV